MPDERVRTTYHSAGPEPKLGWPGGRRPGPIAVILKERLQPKPAWRSAPSIDGLRPDTNDPYDRGHYVYDDNGKPLGLTPEYAPRARRNYDSLQKAIAAVQWPLLAASFPFKGVPTPVGAGLWLLDAGLEAQSNVPPPPKAVAR